MHGLLVRSVGGTRYCPTVDNWASLASPIPPLLHSPLFRFVGQITQILCARIRSVRLEHHPIFDPHVRGQRLLGSRAVHPRRTAQYHLTPSGYTKSHSIATQLTHGPQHCEEPHIFFLELEFVWGKGSRLIPHDTGAMLQLDRELGNPVLVAGFYKDTRGRRSHYDVPKPPITLPP